MSVIDFETLHFCQKLSEAVAKSDDLRLPSDPKDALNAMQSYDSVKPVDPMVLRIRRKARESAEAYRLRDNARPGPRPNAERNGEIEALYSGGTDANALATTYGLCVSRIYQIVKRERGMM